MKDPLDLFIPADELPDLAAGYADGPLSLSDLTPDVLMSMTIPTGTSLVNLLPGVFDAGQLCKVASNYLLDSLDHMLLGSFDSDELIDFRSSRPTGNFSHGRFTLEDFPKIQLYLLWDENSKPFLMLCGTEPDLRWQSLASCIIDLMDSYDISQHISLRGVPAEVPHTRMITIIPHANEIAEPNHTHDPSQPEIDGFTVPLSFSAYLEIALESAGLPSEGFVAHVPHYLSRGSFPAGSLALLRQVSEKLNLSLPLIELGDISETTNKMVDRDLQDNDDLASHIQMLENIYDKAQSEGGQVQGIVLDMPTADELGDRMERFLAEETFTSGLENPESNSEGDENAEG